MKSVGEWIVLENILLDEVNTAYSPSSGVRGSKSLDVSLSPGGMVRRGVLGRGLTGHGCYERGNGKTAVACSLRIRKGEGINYKKNV